jgi:hypothetical protein
MDFPIHCPHCLQWRDLPEDAVDSSGKPLRTGFEGEPYSCSNPNCPAPRKAHFSGDKRLIQAKFNAKHPDGWFKSIPFKVINTDKQTKRETFPGPSSTTGKRRPRTCWIVVTARPRTVAPELITEPTSPASSPRRRTGLGHLL